jgi:molecular chaperone GrpE
MPDTPDENGSDKTEATAPMDIPVEVESPPDKLTELEKEKKDLHDRLLRTAADFDNFRKRSRKDQDEARAKAKEDVLREVLPVVDNLERALAASQDASGPIVDGVRLVLRQLVNALERFEVKPVASVGEVFDPSKHEAIAQIETAERPPGTIHAEMQKGYTMGGRLIRPALVAVARAPAEAPPASEKTE